MVEGLLRRWPELDIRLSPRSQNVSEQLAALHRAVQRETTNSNVVAASDFVVLSVRPPQLEEALYGVSFVPGQTVLSCVTGIPLDALRELCAPAAVVRLLPVPTIARHDGPLLICPPHESTRRLFEGFGTVIEIENEQALLALWAGSATMSTFFSLQAHIVDQIAERGVSADTARAYLTTLWSALATTGREAAGEGYGELVMDHETPGGLNFRIRTHLGERGWFDEVGIALHAALTLPASDFE